MPTTNNHIDNQGSSVEYGPSKVDRLGALRTSKKEPISALDGHEVSTKKTFEDLRNAFVVKKSASYTKIENNLSGDEKSEEDLLFSSLSNINIVPSNDLTQVADSRASAIKSLETSLANGSSNTSGIKLKKDFDIDLSAKNIVRTSAGNLNTLGSDQEVYANPRSVFRKARKSIKKSSKNKKVLVGVAAFEKVLMDMVKKSLKEK